MRRKRACIAGCWRRRSSRRWHLWRLVVRARQLAGCGARSTRWRRRRASTCICTARSSPLAQAVFVVGWSIATRDGRGFLALAGGFAGGAAALCAVAAARAGHLRLQRLARGRRSGRDSVALPGGLYRGRRHARHRGTACCPGSTCSWRWPGLSSGGACAARRACCWSSAWRCPWPVSLRWRCATQTITNATPLP